MKNIYTLLIVLFAVIQAQAQYSTKKVKSKHEAYTDSLKAYEYNHVFPILGQGAYSRGFDIPYPAGIMANYMWMSQGITIDNMQLGLLTDNRDIPLTEVDFIKFGENSNTSYVVNVRPDLWVLPFLNVYGIFGKGVSETEVNLAFPVELKSVVRQEVTTTGFGIMGAGGVGPIWFSVDANFTWNKPELLDEAVNVNVLGLRFGHTFTFASKPDRNIAVWVGGMRTKMQAETRGQIKLSDALPDLESRADEIVANYDYWYNNEATLAQKLAADKVLTPIVERIDEVDGSAVLRYGMDKQVKQLWNGLVGAQFQLNKNWMLRSEAGIVGDRKSFLVSLNYRFKI